MHQTTPGARFQSGHYYKVVEDIVSGDLVLAKDEDSGELIYSRVQQTFIRQADRIYQIRYEDGTLIETTWSHPFYVRSKGWIEARYLRAGDIGETAAGQGLRIASVEIDPRYETVFNFEVEEHHNYFVSEAGVLVHNSPYIGVLRLVAGPLLDLAASAAVTLGVIQTAEALTGCTRESSAAQCGPPGVRLDDGSYLQTLSDGSVVLWQPSFTSGDQQFSEMAAASGAGGGSLDRGGDSAQPPDPDDEDRARRAAIGRNADGARPIDSTRPLHPRNNPEHDATAFNQARAWQNDPATAYVRFNQELRLIDGTRLSRLRPDAWRFRQDGKIDVLEVRSPSQTRAFMDSKVVQYLRILGKRAGDVRWRDPIRGSTRAP